MTAISLDVRTRRLVAVALVAVVVLVLAWRHAQAAGGSAGPLRVAPVLPAAQAPATALEKRLVVDVVGAVRRPGLVRIAAGSRVADAIARAGGLTRRAARSGVNFAAPVADGQQVVVPARGATGAAAAAAGASGASAGPVSLSTATPEQLDGLPGVGPVTAEKIVAYRQQHGSFRSVEELDAIPGIGPARIADLQGLVVP